MPPNRRRRRRPPHEFLAEITVDDDGIRPFRVSQPWARNKLGILASYLRAYAFACRSAGAFYFVDGLAGPGLNHFGASDEWILGSTLIALRTEPQFALTLSMDQSSANVAALEQRTAAWRDRSIVVRGDVNAGLLSMMERHIPSRAPVFVLLDPEGTELQFQTVRAVSRFGSRSRKPELLILLATSFLERLLPNSGAIADTSVDALNRVLPFSGWQTIWRDKQAGLVTPEQERTEYARRYESWLADVLSYGYTASRSVTRPNSAATVYHLIFATDHPAGERIMTDVFGSMHPNEPPRLPGFNQR